MEINKITWYGEPLIDLTQDSVLPESLLIGETAHQANGEIITGLAAPRVYCERSISSVSTEITLQPGASTNRTITFKNNSANIICFNISNIWVIPKNDTSVLTNIQSVDCHVGRIYNNGNDNLTQTQVVIDMYNFGNEPVTFGKICYIKWYITSSWIKRSQYT